MELQRNHRLRFVAELCERLGIDDPVSWFNSVPAQVVDFWLALESVRSDESEGIGEMMSPEKAHKRLKRGR